jgi:hypothetical protein
MAITNFKEILDRRGYLVDSEDRNIFEKEIKKSNFGLGYSDMIEFILYDSNDNQLPQGEDGKMVRYISIDDVNFNEYFLISDNNYTKKRNGAGEYLIDLERLISEAGYSNGIFKTQVTLLNRRVGSEEVNTDKLWIHEISPSRTEVRVLPLKNKNNQDLLKRYGIFTDAGNFRDDTIYAAIPFIENVDVQAAFDSFIRSKGRVREGRQYINLIKSEFKVNDVEFLFKQIRDRYIESMKNFINGRVWNILDINYGKPIGKSEKLELSIPTIRITAMQCLTNSIEYYLPKRDIREVSGLTKKEQESFDKVKQILKSAVSDSEFESTIPSTIDAVVRGCMDPKAKNYNPSAKEDDGSCSYGRRDIDPIDQEEIPDIIVDPPAIKGCTDRTALNYNPKAEEDDGSCQYKQTPRQVTKTYYVWSPTAEWKWKQKGEIKSASGNEYDSFKITYDIGTYKFKGDIREVPKVRKPEPKIFSYIVTNVTYDTDSRPFLQILRGRGKGKDGYRNEVKLEDRLFTRKGNPITFTYKDKLGNNKTSSTVEIGESVVVCAIENTISPIPGVTIVKSGACNTIIDLPPRKIFGCTDPTALNFNRLAEIEDGTCKYKIIIEPIRGCTDSKALNYNSNATQDDGTCKYPDPPPPPVLCNDRKALNYGKPGLCRYPKPLLRCTDRNAINYGEAGACVYNRPKPTPPPRPRGGGGGGGGGNREPAGLAESQFDIDVENINPFTNRGDFVLRTVNDRNFR